MPSPTSPSPARAMRRSAAAGTAGGSESPFTTAGRRATSTRCECSTAASTPDCSARRTETCASTRAETSLRATPERCDAMSSHVGPRGQTRPGQSLVREHRLRRRAGRCRSPAAAAHAPPIEAAQSRARARGAPPRSDHAAAIRRRYPCSRSPARSDDGARRAGRAANVERARAAFFRGRERPP